MNSLSKSPLDSVVNQSYISFFIENREIRMSCLEKKNKTFMDRHKTYLLMHTRMPKVAHFRQTSWNLGECGE